MQVVQLVTVYPNHRYLKKHDLKGKGHCLPEGGDGAARSHLPVVGSKVSPLEHTIVSVHQNNALEPMLLNFEVPKSEI